MDHTTSMGAHRMRTAIGIFCIMLFSPTATFTNAADPPPAASQPVCKLCNGEKVITCRHCDGDWRQVSLTVKCEREQGVGCDGCGLVKCRKCRGLAYVKCKHCGGGGRVRVRVQSGGVFKQNRSERCPECKGSGYVDCEHCDPMFYCERCERYAPTKLTWPWPPPERRTKPTVPKAPQCIACSRVVETREQPRPAPPMRYVGGMAVCPRCGGDGEREVKGKCPHCHQGRVACPICVPIHRP